ncbi:MAG: hypothetical protein HOW73_18345 [Polyangiaceae bacterium]|nr:hypothetical protein [Polyangiaceae bacterium]
MSAKALLSSANDRSDAALVLSVVRLVAAVSCGVFVMSGAVVPAMHGWIVGISSFLEKAADPVAEAGSQLVAILLFVTMIALVVQLLKSRAPLALRALGLVLSCLASMALLITMAIERIPGPIHLILSCSTLALALAFSGDVLARRALVGLVPLGVAVASFLRGIGAYYVERASAARRDVEMLQSAFESARICATIAAVLVVVTAGYAAYQLVRAERRRGIIATSIAAVASLLIAWRATAPVDDGEAAWSVLVRRTAQEMATLPAPHLPAFIAFFASVLPIAVAIAVISVGRRQPVVSGAFALALLAGVRAEVPLLGLGLAVGALALSLDRRDIHGVFAALSNAPRADVPAGSAPTTAEPTTAEPGVSSEVPGGNDVEHDHVVVARPLD